MNNIVLTDNEFFTGLSNLALFMRLYATNTSSVAEKFVESFMTDTLASGNTKVFPWADLPTVSDYKETSSLLTVTKVNAGEEYIQITERKVIKSSYSKYILDMAFTSESGMNEFIGYLLGQMESAKVDHLYNVIINDLFTKVYSGTQLVEVNQYDTSNATSFSEINAGDLINQKAISKAVELTVNNIGVYSTSYNSLGNKEALDVQDMKFVFCEPYHTENIINLFATLLKSDVIEKSFAKPTMYTVPQIKIPSGKNLVIGWLMHKYAYQMFYKFVFMGSFFDVSNLVINNFLHFWYGKGWLENLPRVGFTAKVVTLPSTQE